MKDNCPFREPHATTVFNMAKKRNPKLGREEFDEDRRKVVKDEGPLLTAKQASRQLGISKSEVWHLCMHRHIYGMRISRNRIGLTKESVDRYEQERASRLASGDAK